MGRPARRVGGGIRLKRRPILRRSVLLDLDVQADDVLDHQEPERDVGHVAVGLELVFLRRAGGAGHLQDDRHDHETA